MASAACPAEPQDGKGRLTGATAAQQTSGGLRRDAGAFVAAGRQADNRRWIYLSVGAAVAVVGAVTFGQLRLNVWQRDFYDAVARLDLGGFINQLFVFAAVVAWLLCLGVAQTWLRETLKIQLRNAVSGDLLRVWLVPRRVQRHPAGALALHGVVVALPGKRVSLSGDSVELRPGERLLVVGGTREAA